MKENEDFERVAFIGSRVVPQPDVIRITIEGLILMFHDYYKSEIVSGGAIGIDSMVEEICKKHGVKFKKFLPEYDKFVDKRLAPLARNSTIAEYADRCFAFQNKNSRGTADAIAKFNKLEKYCMVFPMEEVIKWDEIYFAKARKNNK